jgi:hypothetical protein
MTHGFQQQDPGQNFHIPRSVPTPQHGRKSDLKAVQASRPPRTFEPRPGH